jgi:hypothetical protein
MWYMSGEVTEDVEQLMSLMDGGVDKLEIEL